MQLIVDPGMANIPLFKLEADFDRAHKPDVVYNENAGAFLKGNLPFRHHPVGENTDQAPRQSVKPFSHALPHSFHSPNHYPLITNHYPLRRLSAAQLLLE